MMINILQNENLQDRIVGACVFSGNTSSGSWRKNWAVKRVFHFSHYSAKTFISPSTGT